MQSQRVVSDHFTSKQILHFGFAEQHTCMRRCGKTSTSSFMDSHQHCYKLYSRSSGKLNMDTPEVNVLTLLFIFDVIADPREFVKFMSPYTAILVFIYLNLVEYFYYYFYNGCILNIFSKASTLLTSDINMESRIKDICLY